MNTAEILSRLAPETARYPGAPIEHGPGWQDIMQALQGVDPGKTGFMLYTYAGDAKSRHVFFASLFMEVMQDPVAQAWMQQRKEAPGYHRAVETLCLVAVMEWGSERAYTQQIRARLVGVSRGTWCRKYKSIYDHIVVKPVAWEAEVMKIITERLR